MHYLLQNFSHFSDSFHLFRWFEWSFDGEFDKHYLITVCDIAWSNLLQQVLVRLQQLQNRSARIITCCSRPSEVPGVGGGTPIHYLYGYVPPNGVIILKPFLSSRYSYHKAKLVFLWLHSLVPSHFSLYFTRSQTFTIIPQGKVWGYPQPLLNRILGKGPFFLLAQKSLTNSLKHREERKHSDILQASKTFHFIIPMIF